MLMIYILLLLKIEVYFELGRDCDNTISTCLVNSIGCKRLRDETKQETQMKVWVMYRQTLGRTKPQNHVGSLLKCVDHTRHTGIQRRKKIGIIS